MSYELQIYALSPRRPSPREIAGKAGESGIEVELVETAACPNDAATSWEKCLLRATGAKGGFLIEASPDLDRMKDQLRADRAAGENVPDQVLDATRLYVLELDADAPGGEDHQAAFVVSAWALASLTEGIVFDPQEEFFADAESFWGVITDEGMGEDFEETGEETGEEPGEDAHEAGGGCCSKADAAERPGSRHEHHAGSGDVHPWRQRE